MWFRALLASAAFALAFHAGLAAADPGPGADTLQASGRTSSERAAELKAEARRRVAEGTYFGHIAYLSVVARRSA